MTYQNITPARFIARPNRFIAEVEINGKPESVHVKNTGRCRELLIPGCEVFLEKSANPNRKTAYDIVAVKKGKILINMDSQAPNAAADEWLKKSGVFSENAETARERVYGASRFDFGITDGKRHAFLEVKGVTLEENGVAMFPDAPTLRGVKHLCELCECVREGYEAYVLFVIQMKGITVFRPNESTHPEFADALRKARSCGVNLLAYDCVVTPESMVIDAPVPIML